MRYGSVCSGIEAATVAWHWMGWAPQWFCEIEPFPCKLLNHYYPHVPNVGNMLHLKENPIYNASTIELVAGGTPCQDFSVAGLRAGLAGERGNLTLEFCKILIAKQPRWFVWENVPGALSSFSNEEAGPDLSGTGYENGADVTETADFAAILAAFSECGYSCAWRVLDAQFFGVPQRRRRIFVVGYFGNDWRPPAAVLFDGESLPGDIEKNKPERKEVAATVTRRPYADGKQNGTLIPCWWDGGQISQTLDRVLSKGQMMPEKNRFPAVLCYPHNIGNEHCRSNPQAGDPSPALCKSGQPVLLKGLKVRRLTPLECERLQGFPDNWTNIPGASDTARYQALGNSMAVPVMAWIGKRIDIVDKYFNNL